MATTSTSYPKEKINILLLENISTAAAHNFLKNGLYPGATSWKGVNEDELIEAIKDVHLLGIRSKTNITP